MSLSMHSKSHYITHVCTNKWSFLGSLRICFMGHFWIKVNKFKYPFEHTLKYSTNVSFHCTSKPPRFILLTHTYQKILQTLKSLFRFLVSLLSCLAFSFCLSTQPNSSLVHQHFSNSIRRSLSRSWVSPENLSHNHSGSPSVRYKVQCQYN